MKRLMLVPVTIIAAFAGTAALAAFTDTDGDGMMSADEFVAAFPEGTADQFEAADADADGMITEDEYLAAVEAGVLPAE